LDEGGHHHLQLQQLPSGWQVQLAHDLGQRRSPLHEALLAQLCLRVGSERRFFDPQTDSAQLPPGPLFVELGSNPPLLLLELNLDQVQHHYRLSPFECRYLADHERPHPPAPAGPTVALSTDLHSHFAGCPRPDDLLRIGRDLGLNYPASLLAELGIHFGSETVPLTALSKGMLHTLSLGLALPEDRQSPFVDMEAIYRRRAPITKAPAALVPLLRQIAQDYAAMGVRYAELSFYDVLRADVLRTIHRELPAIEEEHRVQLRFLAAFSRHDDFEWDLDLLDRLETLLPSGYLVGVDLMGHETNSTLAFAEVLRRLGRLAARARPGLVVRAHAGENPAHPENVRVVAECLEGEPVELRIGHGVYGVDDATLAKLLSQGVIVELNLSSNLALNNIRCSMEMPLQRYLDAGVPLVLGTDGYGLYGTSLPLEVRAARLGGLSAEGLAKIAATEAKLLAQRPSQVAPFEVPDDAPPSYYGPAVVARKQAQREERRKAWAARREALGLAWIEPEALDDFVQGKQVLAFAGAWRKSFRRFSDSTLQDLDRVLEALLAGLDPAKTILITGGTRHGVEGRVQQLAARRGLPVIGGVVYALDPAEVDGVGLTALCPLAETLYQKAEVLYRFLDRHDGLPIFIGGGPIVADEIQTAANLRLRYWLLDGPEGASTEAALHTPQRAFKEAAPLLLAINDATTRRGLGAPYWHLGPNPTVDLVITRDHPTFGQREVLLIQRSFDAASEPGKWALPGGFQHTDAPRGTPWVRGAESALQAALRELEEETGLDLGAYADHLRPLGQYEGGGRDPRDTPTAWSRTEVFGFHLPTELAATPIAAADDARDTAWFRVDALPRRLAFDHAQILAEALGSTAPRGSP
jgi:ADP-ribose pyrophosphatase YjhB (NUDIX family)/adenosine deaminase